MALRISNPSPIAVLACAKVLQGEVPYNSPNDAIYAVALHDSPRRNLALPAACAVLLEILQEMEKLSSFHGRMILDSSLKIRFHEVL